MDIYVLTIFAVLTTPTGVVTTPAYVEYVSASAPVVCHQRAAVMIPKVRERNGTTYTYQHLCALLPTGVK